MKKEQRAMAWVGSDSCIACERDVLTVLASTGRRGTGSSLPRL
jgi:hypothetical protein